MALLKHLYVVAQNVSNHLALTGSTTRIQTEYKGLSLSDLVFD